MKMVSLSVTTLVFPNLKIVFYIRLSEVMLFMWDYHIHASNFWDIHNRSFQNTPLSFILDTYGYHFEDEYSLFQNIEFTRWKGTTKLSVSKIVKILIWTWIILVFKSSSYLNSFCGFRSFSRITIICILVCVECAKSFTLIVLITRLVVYILRLNRIHSPQCHNIRN